MNDKFKCKYLKSDMDGCYCGIKQGTDGYNRCVLPYDKEKCEYFENKMTNDKNKFEIKRGGMFELLHQEQAELQKALKDKIIEEMAEVIGNTWLVDLEGNTYDVCEVLDEVDIESIASEVVEYYQSKLSKNIVVMTRETYKELKHYEDEMYRLQGEVDKLTNEGWDILDEEEEKIRKNTAENYKLAVVLMIQEMQKYLEINEEQAKILYHNNNEIAKQFDLEASNGQ